MTVKEVERELDKIQGLVGEVNLLANRLVRRLKNEGLEDSNIRTRKYVYEPVPITADMWLKQAGRSTKKRAGKDVDVVEVDL